MLVNKIILLVVVIGLYLLGLYVGKKSFVRGEKVKGILEIVGVIGFSVKLVLQIIHKQSLSFRDT